MSVSAVGEETASEAARAGLSVVTVGDGNVADLLKRLRGRHRLLHLAGEDRRPVDTSHLIDVRTVYRAACIEPSRLPALEGLVIAVHSPRAAARLAELAADRSETVIAAISAAAAERCGEGWKSVGIAPRPRDSSLLALAATLCHTSAQQ